jgi:hypothetical protein
MDNMIRDQEIAEMRYVSLSLSPFPFLLLDHGLYAHHPLFSD